MKLRLLGYELSITLEKLPSPEKHWTEELDYDYQDCECCGFSIGVACGDVYDDDRDNPGCGIYLCELCFGHHIGYLDTMDTCRLHHICKYELLRREKEELIE